MTTSVGYTPLPQTPGAPLLYEDGFCCIYEDRVEIKHFYFPVIGTKTIRYDEIKSVQTGAEMNLQWYDTKHWGISLNNIAWAGDMRSLIRTTTDCIVLEVGDDFFLKGFSCKDTRKVRSLISSRMTKNR